MRNRPIGIAVAVCLTASAPAAVVSVDVQSTVTVLAGRSFGRSGAYQQLVGTARFAIDPAAPANQGIADLKRAARNAKGLVEFSADLHIIRPVDLQKGNGTILFEVVNRGKKGLLSTFNRGRSANEPTAPQDFGDGWLLNAGYTIVSLGWQCDVPKGLMRLNAPTAKGVKGLVRSEYTPDRPTSLIPLGDSGHSPYPILPNGSITLSVRDEIDGPRTVLPVTEWTLATGSSVKLAKPAEPGRIYEVIYESADPAIAGLGLAGIRDLISYLKREHRYAIGFGTSQSAMVLRALLYEGFNQDEAGKTVFDGVFAHVAGARRSTFQRFTQPSRTAGPLRNASLSTTEQFPFADLAQDDHLQGIRDGLLRRLPKSAQLPKIFYTNSTYEYWGSGASLLHTTPDGKRDAPIPDTTRIYMFSGGQHGPAPFPPRSGNGQNLPNFNDYRWALRALLKDLQDWVAKGQQPPPSVYPTRANGTLTSLDKYRFPQVPRIEVPRSIHRPAALNFGPEYRSLGIIANEPPRIIGNYVALVPQSDDNGNDLGGIRMPAIACPLASFTGWNLRNASAGGTKYLLGQTGSYVPFPWKISDRQTRGDPRKAVEELFAGSAEFLSCIEKSSDDLVSKRLLLPEDTSALKEAASQHWQWRSTQQPVVDSAGTGQ